MSRSEISLKISSREVQLSSKMTKKLQKSYIDEVIAKRTNSNIDKIKSPEEKLFN